jgi:hypothetical protein
MQASRESVTDCYKNDWWEPRTTGEQFLLWVVVLFTLIIWPIGFGTLVAANIWVSPSGLLNHLGEKNSGIIISFDRNYFDYSKAIIKDGDKLTSLCINSDLFLRYEVNNCQP